LQNAQNLFQTSVLKNLRFFKLHKIQEKILLEAVEVLLFLASKIYGYGSNDRSVEKQECLP
jgi:hypothetical protein